MNSRTTFAPLEKVLRLFEAVVVNPNDLWVALRMLTEAPDGSRAYKTLVRVGGVGHDREPRSVPIPEDKGLPKFLRSQYDAGRGIVILGKKRKSQHWVKTYNDARKEDVNVMAGPVVLKSSDGTADNEKKEMFMILYVNSPNEDVFVDDYRDYLRVCTDTLSMFFSLAAHMDGEAKMVRSISPLTLSEKPGIIR